MVRSLALTVKSPYEKTEGRWLRGNMHAHTTCSDGQHSPTDLVRAYTEKGYHWLCITDHDKITPPPFDAPDGLCVITGVELTARGPHILHVGAKCATEPIPDRARLLEWASQEGGLLVLNHPNWEKTFNHWPQDLMESMPRRFHGIEIYNGIVIRHEGSPLATDRWDQLLSKGIPVWGYANDDTHSPLDVGNAWNCVCCEEAAEEEILRSLASGRFYASTGVEISTLATEGTRIRLVASKGSLCVPVIDWGIELGRFQGRAWEFDLEELVGERNPTYIRFEIHGDGLASAWTQPLYLKWG